MKEKYNHTYIGWICLLIGLMLSACVHDLSDHDLNNTPLSFYSVIYDTPNESTLAMGLLDQIGVYAYQRDGDMNVTNWMIDQAIEATGGDLFYPTSLFWPAVNQAVSFFAYAPKATEQNGISAKGEFEAGDPHICYSLPVHDMTTQSDIFASVPIYDRRHIPGLPDVSLTFMPMLSRIKITAKGKGVVSKVELGGFWRSAELNISSHQWFNHADLVDRWELPLKGKQIVLDGDAQDLLELDELKMIPQKFPQDLMLYVTVDDQVKEVKLSPYQQHSWSVGQAISYNLSLRD